MEKVGVSRLSRCLNINQNEFIKIIMKTCKFCGKSFHKLSDSHIAPRAFFEYTKKISGLNEKENMLSVTNTKGVYPFKKMTIGWYDNNLVCKECEKIFGKYDDYAISVLLKKQEMHKNVFLKGQHVGWLVDDVDFNKFKLFFISVLWRALASNRSEYKRIASEECLTKAKEIIQSNKADNDDFFSVILGRFTDKIGLEISVDPYEQKIDDVRFFRFYPGAGYIFYIKADRKPLPEVFLKFNLKKDNPLFIFNKGNFMLTKECQVLEKVIAEADKEVETYKNR